MQLFDKVVILSLGEVDLGNLVPVISLLQLVDHLVIIALWWLVNNDRNVVLILSTEKLSIVDGDTRNLLANDCLRLDINVLSCAVSSVCSVVALASHESDRCLLSGLSEACFDHLAAHSRRLVTHIST